MGDYQTGRGRGDGVNIAVLLLGAFALCLWLEREHRRHYGRRSATVSIEKSSSDVSLVIGRWSIGYWYSGSAWCGTWGWGGLWYDRPTTLNLGPIMIWRRPWGGA